MVSVRWFVALKTNCSSNCRRPTADCIVESVQQYVLLRTNTNMVFECFCAFVPHVICCIRFADLLLANTFHDVRCSVMLCFVFNPWFVRAAACVGYALRVSPAVTRLTVYRWPQVFVASGVFKRRVLAFQLSDLDNILDRHT